MERLTVELMDGEHLLQSNDCRRGQAGEACNDPDRCFDTHLEETTGPNRLDKVRKIESRSWETRG